MFQINRKETVLGRLLAIGWATGSRTGDGRSIPATIVKVGPVGGTDITSGYLG